MFLEILSEKQKIEITSLIMRKCEEVDYSFTYSGDAFCDCKTWELKPLLDSIPRPKKYIFFHDGTPQDPHNKSYRDFLLYVKKVLDELS